MERRFEREARSVFVPLGDEPGPAPPLTEAEQQAQVLAAVRRARKPKSGRAFWQAAAGTALALSAIGAAAAAVTTYLTPAPEPAREQSPRQAAARARPARTRPPASVALQPTAAQSEVEAQPTPAAPSAPAAPARARDLLREANALRAKGHYGRAERMYATVARGAADPGDVEAATVAAAELRLEKLGDPRGALALFRRTLAQRPGGALSEEARYGQARCQRALGDAPAEAAALRSFLAAHPESVLASPVRARLQALAAQRP